MRDAFATVYERRSLNLAGQATCICANTDKISAADAIHV